MAGQEQAHLAIATIVHGIFWREVGEGEEFLAACSVPEEMRDMLRDLAGDLTTAIADRTATAMCLVMESPGLLAEYQTIDARGEWEDGDLLALKAALLMAGGDF